MPLSRRMREAALRKSRLGRWPFAPSALVTVSYDASRKREGKRRTVVELNVAERMVRIVKSDRSPD